MKLIQVEGTACLVFQNIRRCSSGSSGRILHPFPASMKPFQVERTVCSVFQTIRRCSSGPIGRFVLPLTVSMKPFQLAPAAYPSLPSFLMSLSESSGLPAIAFKTSEDVHPVQACGLSNSSRLEGSSSDSSGLSTRAFPASKRSSASPVGLSTRDRDCSEEPPFNQVDRLLH